MLFAQLLEQALGQREAPNVCLATQRDLPLPQTGRDDDEEDAGDDQNRSHRRVLPLEATRTQHTPRSGTLLLCVRVGRPVKFHAFPRQDPVEFASPVLA